MKFSKVHGAASPDCEFPKAVTNNLVDSARDEFRQCVAGAIKLLCSAEIFSPNIEEAFEKKDLELLQTLAANMNVLYVEIACNKHLANIIGVVESKFDNIGVEEVLAWALSASNSEDSQTSLVANAVLAATSINEESRERED